MPAEPHFFRNLSVAVFSGGNAHSKMSRSSMEVTPPITQPTRQSGRKRQLNSIHHNDDMLVTTTCTLMERSTDSDYLDLLSSHANCDLGSAKKPPIPLPNQKEVDYKKALCAAKNDEKKDKQNGHPKKLKNLHQNARKLALVPDAADQQI